jgi:hypothetical protein
VTDVGGVAHTDIAAYVLGVLDDAGNAVFEAHLLDCPHCQLDLLEMYDLPEILAEVRKYWPDPPIPQPRALGGLLDEVALHRRRRRMIGRIVGAAAVLLIVAGPLITLALLPSGDSYDATAPVAASAPASAPPTATGAAALFAGGEAGKALQAQVVVQPTAWGSAIELALSGVTGPEQVVTGWTVPAAADGTVNLVQPLRISGGSAFAPAEIARFEIRTDGGAVLTSIPR